MTLGKVAWQSASDGASLWLRLFHVRYLDEKVDGVSSVI
jgi:hypothetical protein